MNNIEIVKRALEEYGVKGIQGPEANPKILSYFNKSGKITVQEDEVPWCSAFMNFIADELGLEKTEKLNARSWLDLGIEKDKAELGDIVILWRESKESGKGHGGIFIKMDNNFVYLLGGNQNNEVNISEFPKEKVLGIRELRKV